VAMEANNGRKSGKDRKNRKMQNHVRKEVVLLVLLMVLNDDDDDDDVK